MRLAGRIDPGNGAAIFGGQSESRSLPMLRYAMCFSPDDGPRSPPTFFFFVVSDSDVAVDFFFADAAFGVVALLPAFAFAGAAGLADVSTVCRAARAGAGDNAVESAVKTSAAQVATTRRPNRNGIRIMPSDGYGTTGEQRHEGRGAYVKIASCGQALQRSDVLTFEPPLAFVARGPDCRESHDR